ncbi:MAG: zinc ribbon domain-containing protein, partial [bacterium]
MSFFSKKDTYVFSGVEIPEDIFEVLGIDITCDSTTIISAKIEEMRKKWSQSQSTGTDIYRLKIDSIYTPILTDASQRQDYRVFIQARRQKELEARVRDARVQADLILKDQNASDDQKKRFIRMYSHPFGPTAGELEKWLSGPRTANAPTLPPLEGVLRLLFDLSVEPLPPHKAKTIAENCQKLGKSNLYDYLGVDLSYAEDDARLTSAKKAHEDEKNRLGNTGLDGALKPIHGNLIASIEELLLKDPMRRRQYLRTIGEERIRPMLDALDMKIRSEKDKKLTPSEKILTADYIETLLRSVEGTIPKPVAMQIILERTRSEGYSIQMPSIPTDEVVCPSCQKPNPKEAVTCICGYAFRIACPKCGNVFASRVGRCDKCGLDADTAASFSYTLSEVRRLIKANALSDAQNLIAKAKVDVGSGNTELRELEDLLQRGRGNIDQVLHDARTAVSERQLFKAQQLLESLLQKDRSNADATTLLKVVFNGIDDVKSLLSKARQEEAAGRKEEAARDYAGIVIICTDCSEASDALRRLPPSPPSSLTVSLDQRRVSLQWHASSSQGVSGYAIVRKVGGTPSLRQDGDDVAQTTATMFDDLKAPVGMACFYAIFAVRGDVFSSTGAISSPVLVTSDVEGLSVIPSDGLINLSWSLPGKVLGIQVVRRTDRAPSSPVDGDNIPISNQTTAVDRQVTNGQTYYYGVFCQFRGTDGKAKLSNGAIISARPEPLPTALASFRLILDEKKVKASWTPPLCGEVSIVRSRQPLSMKQGASITKSQVDSLGILLRSIGENEAIDEKPEQAVAYYTALTINAQIAVVGVTQKFANLPDVTATRLEKNAGVLQAYWKWPPETTVAMVGWRSDSYPTGIDDSKATMVRLTIAEFNSKGRFVLPISGDTDCYLSVFAGLVAPDGDVFACGQSDGAKAFSTGEAQITVTYTVKKGFLSSKRKLVFVASCDCLLPSAVIVAKPGALPMTIT